MTTKCISRRARFGDLLRRWRSQRGISQGAFGKLLQPHARRSTVSCWEKGIRRPSFKFLGQILIITGIPAHLALAAPPSPREGGRRGGRGARG
jgi:transcriptional regulator with XRE-family HTH domain